MVYKSNSSKFWTGFLAVLLALVLAGTAALVGVLSDGFRDWSKFTDEEQAEELPEDELDNGAPVMDENGNELSSEKPVAMPRSMLFRSAAALDTQAAEYDSVTLEATVLPEEATDKSVDWSVMFVSPSSEWASGKTVTDYVTVTPESDGSTTATVQCLLPFGEKIKVVVTSRQNESVKAECTVDFAARITGASISLSNVNTTYDTEPYGVGSNPAICFDTQGGFDQLIGTYELKYTYSDHTVSDSFTETVNVNFTSTYLDALEAAGLTPGTNSIQLINGTSFFVGSCFGLNIFSRDESFNTAETWNKYVGALYTVATMPVFPASTIAEISLSAEGTYSSVTDMFVCYVVYPSSGLITVVEGIELDQSNVVV